MLARLGATDAASFEGFTKFAGKGGLGLEYLLPQSNLGLFAQGSGRVMPSVMPGDVSNTVPMSFWRQQ